MYCIVFSYNGKVSFPKLGECFFLNPSQGNYNNILSFVFFTFQLRLQKDQCGKYHNECLAESGRACEERNMEVVILQCSISCLEKQLDDLQKKYAALQTRHADLENRHTDLQNRHADLQYRHDTLQAQVTLS